MSRPRPEQPHRPPFGLISLALASILVLAVWAVIVVFGTLGGWWRPMLAPRGEARTFMAAAVQVLDARSKGNVAFVLLKNGVVFDQHFQSRGAPVNSDTLFQMASVSKWVTAWGVMKLVEDGRIELDAPVSRYLTRWHLPKGDYSNDGVTIRRLLSHTAGLTDHLGFQGFLPGVKVQTLEEALTYAADVMPGRDGRVRVGAEPGKTFIYSGGGYALLELLIEEVSGEPFNAYMQRAILKPLDMTRSTFVLADGTANVAEFFNDGAPAQHYRFAATSTSSLYTTAAEMTRFVQASLPGPNGEAPGRGVLSAKTLTLMVQPSAYVLGFPIWGLGVVLIAPNNANGFVIGHDGHNEPSVNTAVRFDPATGDGIVILQTGSPTLASEVAGHWVFWHVGKIGLPMVMLEARQTLIIFALGAAVIILIATIFGWRNRAAKR